jgi:hypothetical protein
MSRNDEEGHAKVGLEVPELPLSLVLSAISTFCYAEGCLGATGGFDREGCETCLLTKAYRRGREGGYVLGWYDRGTYERGELK